MGDPSTPHGRSPSGKLCPSLILEGTRLTGKTELAFAMPVLEVDAVDRPGSIDAVAAWLGLGPI